MRSALDWAIKKFLDNAFTLGAPIVTGLVIDLLNYWGTWRTAAISVLMAVLVWMLLMFFRQERRLELRRNVEEEFDALLRQLDAGEVDTVLSFHGVSTRELALDHPIIAGLSGKRILVPAIRNGQIKRGSDGEIHHVFFFMLSPLGFKVLERLRAREERGST